MASQPISISVKRVKEIFFSINEQLFIPDPDKIVRIELGERLGFNIEGNLVNFILRIYYHYLDAPEVLVDMQVENLFQVGNLKDYLTKEGIILLPPGLITSIVGISLSHGRALMFKNTIGTRWEEIVLPVTNPEDVARYLYPYMFGQEARVHVGDLQGNKKGESISVSKKKRKAVKN
jgi:hypothetical protein